MHILFIAIIIGSIIGYFTNSLAIKMLFRPLKPWKIGNWKVPFTPGLIPRRKEEIAESIGKLVENYLLTPAGLKEFIEKTKLQEQLYMKLSEKINSLSNELTIGKFLASTYSEEWREELVNLSGEKIVDLINDEKIKEIPLKDLLSNDTITKLEDNLKLLSPYLLKRIKSYLQTIEGRRFIEDIFRQSLEGKKLLGFFAGFLLEGNQFQEKIIVYLEQMLDDEKTHNMLDNLINKEWDRIKNKSIGSIVINNQDLIEDEVKIIIKQGLEKIEEASIKRIYQYFEEYNLVNRIYNQIIELAISKIDSLFYYLSISDVVKEEVNRFSLEKLETIIIDIAGKELKMITYLGGIIGALIGLFQGLLYLLI